MAYLKPFAIAIYDEWRSVMTSSVIAIVLLFIGPFVSQKWIGLLLSVAGVLGLLFASYRLWVKEYKRARDANRHPFDKEPADKIKYEISILLPSFTLLLEQMLILGGTMNEYSARKFLVGRQFSNVSEHPLAELAKETGWLQFDGIDAYTIRPTIKEALTAFFKANQTAASNSSNSQT